MGTETRLLTQIVHYSAGDCCRCPEPEIQATQSSLSIALSEHRSNQCCGKRWLAKHTFVALEFYCCIARCLFDGSHVQECLSRRLNSTFYPGMGFMSQEVAKACIKSQCQFMRERLYNGSNNAKHHSIKISICSIATTAHPFMLILGSNGINLVPKSQRHKPQPTPAPQGGKTHIEKNFIILY